MEDVTCLGVVISRQASAKKCPFFFLVGYLAPLTFPLPPVEGYATADCTSLSADYIPALYRFQQTLWGLAKLVYELGLIITVILPLVNPLGNDCNIFLIPRAT